MTFLLSLIHNATTLLFGVFVSAFFLGVKKTRHNIFILSVFFWTVATVYFGCFLLAGEKATIHIYPLLVHIPLILFLVLYYRYHLINAAVSVFSVYLCCQISNWAGLVVLDVTGTMQWYYIVRIMVTCVMFYILGFRVCRTMEVILNKDTREVFAIGSLPLVYYIFDYGSTKFSDVLYSGDKAVAEFMGFAFCLSYLIFVLFYVREYEKKMELRQYSNLMELQLQSVHKEIEYVEKSKRKLSIMRHDMRHQLHIIQVFLQEGHIAQAMDYIKEIDGTYEEMSVARYCKNELLNSVIAIYEGRFADRGFTLRCNIVTEEQLPCSDTALCMILSNALENAMHALEESDKTDRWVSLKIAMKGQHLLLELRNPVEKIPQFVDGIPVSAKEGHGIGVKSIIYYVERMKGQYQFIVSEHVFILRVIIGGKW